ncbi:MAG: Uma2 family endonuclease [Symploca sp. SIO1A3]|nr:Uma2 family endonuclease [Symploca sp. SIO1A3]
MTSSSSLKFQPDTPLLPRQNLPTMYDLPSEDPKEPGLPDEFHALQAWLLCLTFFPLTFPPEQVFSACDLNIYYDLNHPQWHKRPDWFGVVGTSRLYEGHDTRDSYVTWIEPINPAIVVELLSRSTKKQDLGEIETEGKEIEEGPDKPPSKWEVYESILKIPYYVVFNRRDNKIRIFHLEDGLYQEVELTEGRLYLPELGISLGVWQGSFRSINRVWLRWFTRDGELILSPEEKAFQDAVEAKQEAAEAKAEAKQEAAEAKQEAAEAKQETAEAQKRVEQLMEQLRQLGINPDEIDN